ncbi:MAG: class I SAM-dependent RNA methyltransferase [Spirochaetes bacterium]|nr:class I SAM-dependent RNA methyltransferase [Spirochaetota bacterium]
MKTNSADKTITITLEKPVYGGFCLGRHAGKAVLVPFGIPGETVRVSIYDEKKDYSFGRIESPVVARDDRLTPDCPHFEECGGCSYLHVSYENELDMKTAILRESLERIAGLAPDQTPPIDIVSGGRLHYRSHASIKAPGGDPGFYRRGTNDIVPFRGNGCLLLDEELNSRIAAERSPGDFRAAVEASGRVITSRDNETLVTEREGGITFRRHIGQFFQANRFLRGRMLEIVRRYAGLVGSESFLDVGCGVGFFTLFLSGSAREGTGIDVSRGSIGSARENAALNGIGNVRFRALHSSRVHPSRAVPDAVIIDPPRAGIDRKTRQTLSAIGSRLVYVSCNPSTFSRDAKDLLRGGYRLDRLTLIDMFPATHHIEVISLFTPAEVSRPAGE